MLSIFCVIYFDAPGWPVLYLSVQVQLSVFHVNRPGVKCFYAPGVEFGDI